MRTEKKHLGADAAEVVTAEPVAAIQLSHADDDAPFTLGPWQLEDDDSPAGCRIGIVSESGAQIAEVLNFDDFPCLSGDDDCDAKCKTIDDEARANAHLIAAAPELYAVIKSGHCDCGFVYDTEHRGFGERNHCDNACDRVRDLLARAEGL